MTHPVIHRPQAPHWLRRVFEKLQARPAVLNFALGVGLSWGGMYYVVARPLARQVDALQSRIGVMTDRVSEVAALKGGAQQTADLLSVLADQQASFVAARESLGTVRQLRIELEQESRLTASAAEELAGMGRLQEQVVKAGARSAELHAAMDALAALQTGVASLGNNGEKSLANLDAAAKALDRLAGLKSSVAAQAENLAQAEQTAAASSALQQSLAAAAATTRQAQASAEQMIRLVDGLSAVTPASLASSSDNAADLLAVHDILSNDDALQIPLAERNLRSLLSTQAELLRTTPQIAAAAENLDLLCDFQDELTRQLRQLGGMRSNLSEIAMLQDTIARACAAIEPLTQLSNLRRLDSDEIRAMAREILERRTAQITPVPCELPTAVTDIGTGTLTDSIEKTVPEPRQN